MNGESFHSVTLDTQKCKGCTTCIRYCPTEAIRVRKGKAYILDERCIDCGECIRVCPNGAKKAVSDPLLAIDKYAVRVAIPAPTLYGQFNDRFSVNQILNALLKIGFTDIFEVARAAELVSDATASFLEKAGRGPWISSACPAVVKLLQLRFPSLLDRLVPVISPMEAAARIVKEQLYPERTDVGVFFISPCAAKVTVSRNPQGVIDSAVDGVIAIKDVYMPILNALPDVVEKPLASASARGIAWAHIEGESEALSLPKAISVAGIHDIIGVFEALENGKMKDIAFIEALACPAGCVGGPLTVENPYIARARIRAWEKLSGEIKTEQAEWSSKKVELAFSSEVKARPGLRLSPDRVKAMLIFEEAEIICESLPGLDCGSCGAPSCRAFAEDVAKGDVALTACIFKLRENVRKLAEELILIESIQPPGLDTSEDVPGSNK